MRRDSRARALGGLDGGVGVLGVEFAWGVVSGWRVARDVIPVSCTGVPPGRDCWVWGIGFCGWWAGRPEVFGAGFGRDVVSVWRKPVTVSRAA